ncbi:MAG: hypothetical protein RBT41_12625, partial [Clostridia bacterium]|nr:hypothetical protein [Clostridia bacterium]
MLSAGSDNGDGTWTLASGDLPGLTLTPPADFHGTIALEVTATSTDGSTSTPVTVPVSVSAVND